MSQTLSAARRVAVVAVVVLATLVVGALPAVAHVTVSADTTAPEAFAVYTVRVPNESETATTTSVEVEMPEGFEASRYRPLPGWDVALEGGVLTVEAADGNDGIAPGEFQEFEFQARNPADAGHLVFPAVQTYDDGEVARWTGSEDAEQPAPVVTIGADGTGQDEGDTGAGATATSAAGDDPAADEAPDGGAAGAAGGSAAGAAGGAPGAVTWLALVLGAVGTVVGGLALVRARRA